MLHEDLFGHGHALKSPLASCVEKPGHPRLFLSWMSRFYRVINYGFSQILSTAGWRQYQPGK